MARNQLICTLVQQPIVWENVDANLAHYEQCIAGISGHKQLVLLPETFATGFSVQNLALAQAQEGSVLGWMRRVAREQGIVLGGSVLMKEGPHAYNRFIWMQPNGQHHFYNKRHLFGLGQEAQQYRPGEQRVVVQLNGWKLLLQVCYDLRFPVWARQQQVADANGGLVPEYDVLINVANWPMVRHAAWETLLRARAIENQCYVLAVNRVGIDGLGMDHLGGSVALDPLGQTLWQGGATAAVHTVILEKEALEDARSKFPFLGDADAFHIRAYD